MAKKRKKVRFGWCICQEGIERPVPGQRFTLQGLEGGIDVCVKDIVLEQRYSDNEVYIQFTYTFITQGEYTTTPGKVTPPPHVLEALARIASRRGRPMMEVFETLVMREEASSGY